MRSIINISRSDLLHNLELFKQMAGSRTFIPIIKSNAYGHGLGQVYEVIGHHVNYLGVNYVDEASSLRALGYRGKILVVGPPSDFDLGRAVELDAELTIGDFSLLDSWIALADRPKIHIKIDTGMCRQGFLPDDLQRLVEKVGPFGSYLVGISSHFSNVEDVTAQTFAELQMKRFDEAVRAFREHGMNPPSHIASSASTLILDHCPFDMIRIGISLFGYWPSQATKLSYQTLHQELASLRPTLTWRTEVAATKVVPKGQYVGYGCSYKTVDQTKIGIVPVGYAEGYPRLAGQKGAYVIVQDTRCRVLGRICMNMMMVDLTHLGDVKAGEVVTLLGRDQQEEVTAQQLGDWSETIHYEVLARLSCEIPRRLV